MKQSDYIVKADHRFRWIGGLLFLILGLSSCLQREERNDKDIFIPVAQNVHKWGYIDCNGKVRIPLKYRTAGYFQDGLAKVQDQNSRIGFIRIDGTYAIAPEYADATDFSEGRAFAVRDNEYPICIDKRGKTLFKLDSVEMVEVFHGKRAKITSQNGKIGFADTAGFIVIPMIYDEATNFELSPYSIVKKDGKYGAIDKEGHIVIPIEYREMKPFAETSKGMLLAPVKIDEKWGYIDIYNRVVIKPKYDRAKSFSEGLAPVQIGNKSAFIAPDGNIQFAFTAEDAFPMREGRARFKKNGLYGYIDRSGKAVVKAKYETAEDFHDGRAFVRNELEAGWEALSESQTVPPAFQSASKLTPKHILIEKNSLYGIANPEGMLTLLPKYRYAANLPTTGKLTNTYILSRYYDAEELLAKTFRDNNPKKFFGLSDSTNILQLIQNITQYKIHFGISGRQNCAISHFLKEKPIEINPDIQIPSLVFEFNKPIQHNVYDYLKEPYKAESIKLIGLKVLYGLKEQACGKSKAIAIQIAKKIEEIYRQKMKMAANKNIFFSTGKNKIYFLIAAGNTRIGLMIFFNPDNLSKEINKYNQLVLNYIAGERKLYDENPIEQFITMVWGDDFMQTVVI